LATLPDSPAELGQEILFTMIFNIPILNKREITGG
jgi:hypothetical protein